MSRCRRRAIAAASRGQWIGDDVRGLYIAGAYHRSRPEQLLVQLSHSNAPSPPEAGCRGTLVVSMAWYGLWELKIALYGGVLRSGAAEVELGPEGDIDFQVESWCQGDFLETASFLAERLATFAMTLAVVTTAAVESTGPVVTVVLHAFLGTTLRVQLVHANHFRLRHGGCMADFTCNLLVAVPVTDPAAPHELAHGGVPPSASTIGLHTKTTHLKRCRCVELRLLPGAPAHYTVERVIDECKQLVFGCLKDPSLGNMPDRMDRLLTLTSLHPRSLALLKWRFVPRLVRQPTYDVVGRP